MIKCYGDIRGVALVQVLLMTMILTILALYIAKSVQWQIASAQASIDKLATTITVRSVQNEILFKLATTLPEKLVSEDGFNFHDQVFEYKGARVEIQDLNGLLSIPLQTNSVQLLALLKKEGVPAAQAETLARRIADYNNGSGEVTRPTPILFVDELRRIADGLVSIDEKLLRNFTFQITPGINPLTAPETLLELVSSSAVANKVTSLRTQDGTTIPQLQANIPMYNSDTMTYSIGPGFRLRITAEAGDSFTREQVTFWVSGDDERQPITILDTKPDY